MVVKRNFEISYLIKLLKKYIYNVNFINGEISIYLKKSKYLDKVLSILKNHTYFNYEVLTDITVVDVPNNFERFTIVYNCLSIKRNKRLMVKCNTSEYKSIPSITKIYNSANWLERECWDMFGVSFLNNSDLRRILTDYGFKGFPLRKDFPLNGYIELNYNEEINCLVYDPIELTQELRFYDFESPWGWQVSIKDNKK